MRPSLNLLIYLLALIFPLACIDPIDLTTQGTNDILVVDGLITDQVEPQLIKLNRSQADRLTGQFSTIPLSKATVAVVVDSATVVSCHETIDGTYQLPSDFRGQVGHAYQLRFTLPDGTRYVSAQQVMQPVSPIAKVTVKFNPTSLSAQQLDGYTAAHDIFVDTQDPAGQHNYYRWEWKLWERQFWCKTCLQGVYSYYKVLPNMYRGRDYFVTGTERLDDCFSPPAGKAGEEAPEVPREFFLYDYQCQTPCWHIFYGYDITVLDDKFLNGSPIIQQRVAQVPFYDAQPALVDIRQLSLSPDAYRYYKLFQDQTQKTGGLADTPASVLIGNIRQVDNPDVGVVGYFSASASSLVHYWLNRTDTEGLAFGATDPSGPHLSEGDDLFYVLNRRRPTPEPPPPYLGERERPKVRLWPFNDRPPLVPCLLSDNQTPFKPEGWRD
ncbi:DUF4249 domain-containing protein [Spirosoma fluminis]